MLLQKPNNSPLYSPPTAPLLSPLGDYWLATDCLSLKVTIRN